MGLRNKSTHLTGVLAPAWVLTLHWHVLYQEVHLESLSLWTRFPTGLTEAPARKQKFQLVPSTEVILSLTPI